MSNYLTVNLRKDLITQLRSLKIIPTSKDWRDKGETPEFNSINDYFYNLVTADLKKKSSKPKRG